MVGIVIASHGRLAEEFLGAARQILGEFPRTATCNVPPAASLEELRTQLQLAIKSVDDGDGVLLFADLIGGSPCTQGLSLCRQSNLEVITGVNLPMLLKANSLRLSTTPLPELARQLAAYGQRNIVCATDSLRAQAAL